MANDDVFVLIENGTYVPSHKILSGDAICFTPPAGGCMVKFDHVPTKTDPHLDPNSEGFYMLAGGKEKPYAFKYELAVGATIVHYWLAAPDGKRADITGPGHPVEVGGTGVGGK